MYSDHHQSHDWPEDPNRSGYDDEPIEQEDGSDMPTIPLLETIKARPVSIVDLLGEMASMAQESTAPYVDCPECGSLLSVSGKCTNQSRHS